MNHAYLFYVVGRSGVGKDTVLNELRRIEGCAVAHRYITRDATAGSENHIALSEHEFKTRQSLGAFLLDWEAHGNYYGIGIEVRHWLECGLSVFVNGSRHCLAQAKQKIGRQMISVLIDADDHVCQQRLANRGRECEAGIRARMNRDVVNPDAFDWVIDNSGPLEDTIESIQELWQATHQRGGYVQ